MTTKTVNTRIANKRDTILNWNVNNPVLLNGEIVIIDDENYGVKLKIGDGSSSFSSLENYTLVPNVTTSNNSKILSITNGNLTWVDQPQYKIQPITQEEYDALSTKDSNTLYVIGV